MKKYPLEQLVIIKKKKLDEAERVLREKKDKLAEEEKKLKKTEEVRDKAKTHKQDKLVQIRQSMDEGERTDKIQQMRTYLKLAQEKYLLEEKKVEEQKKQVQKALDAVETARLEMIKRQRDVEKLKEHHKEWKADTHKELEKEEEIEADEMGGSRYIRNKQKKKDPS